MRRVPLAVPLAMLFLFPGVRAAAGDESAKGEFAERLERARKAEERFREMHGAARSEVFRRAAVIGSAERRAELERARRSPLAAGPTWVSLGPADAPQGNFNGAFPGLTDSGLINAIAIHPSEPRTIFVGPAGGGVWRSRDAGATWAPLTDDIGPTPIGAIAIAPSDPKRIYAGGGSGRQSLGNDVPGPGLLVSTDGGDTWTLSASSPGGEFWFIRVDPANPRVLLAGTDKGLLRSTDGGDTWTKTLAAAGDAWANALAVSPANPSLLLAATFRRGVESFQGGACVVPASSTYRPGRLWKSTDGGATWDENVNLPGSGPPVKRSRVELAFAPSDPAVVYALIAKGSVDANGCSDDLTYGDLFDVAKSTDGGDSWSALGAADALKDLPNGQMYYAAALSVDPRDARTVWVGGLDNYKSTDGGATWKRVSAWTNGRPAAPYVHADQHFHLWAPDGSTLYLGCDGGLFSTTDGGASYASLNRGLVTFQFFSVCQSPAAPGVVMGGAQDNGTSLRKADGSWTQVIGGDGFGCLLHPTNPQILLGSVQNERFYRSTDGGNLFGGVSITPGTGDTSTFLTRLVQDPASPEHVLTSTTLRLWESLDGGGTWKGLGTGTIPGIASVRDFALSPIDSKIVGVAANSGKVLLSSDGGATFSPAGTLPVNTLSSIRFDRTNPRNLWVASALATAGVERVFASTDGGATWSAISRTGKPNGLPDLPVAQMEQDPLDPNVLWAVSYVGVYRSPDRGGTWARYGTGLPNVPLSAISILPDGSKMRLATFGRAIWEISLVALPPDQPPSAAIDVPAATPTLDAGLPASFHGVATDPDAGDVLTLTWDFGDGRTAAGASASHAFAVPGTYTVKFRATDAAGLFAEATRTVNVRIPQGSVATGPELFLPVVLDVVGAGGAHYTTELTLISRAASPTTVLLQYTGSAGGGSGYASVTLQPGEVRVVPDAISFLTSAGLPLPADGTRIGTLRAIYPGAAADEVFIGGRTSTPGAGGTFGLFYTGASASATTATVFGLQQSAAQRSNLALVNAGPDPVTLRVALQGPNGEALTGPSDQTLPGWGWTQINQPLLGQADSGRAVVTKISGAGPFTAYGVLNDATTSDGSFVPALVPGDVSGADRLVPIVLAAAGYRSELTLTNFTTEPMPLTLTYTGSPQLSASGSGSAALTLQPGEQRILPDSMAFLRSLGLQIPSSGNVGGALRVKAPNGTPASSLAAGARTFTNAAGGGTFGLFYPGLTHGESATALAYINGLQQNAVQRSNLAVVNRGDAADAITLKVTYFGADGAALADPDTATLAPGEWRQFNQPLGARGALAGFARIERLAGASRWVAYGILNDQHNSDGSYIPMSR
ncbi:MAG TPA: PKD domain-containing protein [Thermoanaerobaculia bacterium]|nr:PKD domain-containing protein [Thermoanaerobaculia bacterium]